MRHLLYCINRSYVEQMMVSLSSVLRHGQLGPLDVQPHLLHPFRRGQASRLADKLTLST